MKSVLHVSTPGASRRHSRTTSFAMKALPSALALAFLPAGWAADPINVGAVAGLPVNGVVRDGDVASGIVSGSGNTLTLTVTQTTDKAVIDWRSFNIDVGKTVQFVQPTGGAVLNRVNAATDASQIAGTLSANGMVMLMNPHGVLFSPGSSVNVGALIATTGTIDENTFSKNSAQITGAAGGVITNRGNITAGASGLVALVAPSVINQGVITATGGTVALLGSTAATISFNNNLYEFAIPGGATGTEVTNAGGASLSAANLYLQAGDAASVLSGVINLEGVQQASKIVVNGDTVMLKSALAASSVTGNSGTVNVSGTARIQDGVNIVKSGGAVNVAAGTYAETVNIGKALSLKGAGVDQSIVAPGSGDAFAISGNIGANATVLIDGFTFQNAPGSGVSAASNTVLGQLTVQNSSFKNNSRFGFSVNGTPTAGVPGLANVLLSNNTFVGNGNPAAGAASLGLGDVQFNYFNGNAILRNLHITGTGEHTGIHFRGYHNASGGAVHDAGQVVFDNVTLDGSFRRPTGTVGTWNPGGPGYGIHIFEYASVENVSFNDVVVDTTVGHGLAVEGLGSTLDIGNTRFGVADSSVTGGGTNPTASLNIATGTNSQNNVKSNVNATRASFTGAQNGFDIEDRVGHALDATGVGLVTWNAGNVYVTQASGSVQRGVNAASVGNTVNVAAGTYSENITIDKALTLDGAGMGQTILKAPSSASGDAVAIKASGVTLSDLSVNDSFYGVHLRGTANNATINRVAFNNNQYSVRSGTDVKADNFRMLNSTIAGGLIGVNILNGHDGAGAGKASFKNALFENVTVDGTGYKGFYFETADNLTMRNVTVTNAGNVGNPDTRPENFQKNGAGIDINLKYDDFSSLTFDNVVVKDSGASSDTGTGVAMVIKTRGVPGDSSEYTPAPASLQSVNIIGGSIEDSVSGLRVETLSNGNGGQSAVTISGGTQFRNNRTDITVDQTNVDARGAVFVGAADGFAVENRVTHALDTVGRGLVTWNAGNVYVTQASGSVQRGVNAAGVGDTVNVANASFAENVAVNSRRNLAFNDTRLQSLTLNSGAAGSGIGGAVTAEGAGGFNFNTNVNLLADTTLTTRGADINFNGDIQNAGGVARALRLVAGSGATRGNVHMNTGGSAGNALGYFDVSANNFKLDSTLWVSAYAIDALGKIELSNSTLRAQGSGAASTLNAGGDVTGSTISEGSVAVVSAGDIVANIAGTDVVAQALGNMTVVVAASNSATLTANTVVANVTAPTLAVAAVVEATVSGSAGQVTLDAPRGSVSGSFGQVNNTGTGVININGKPQPNPSLSSNTENNRVVPTSGVTDDGGEGTGIQLAQADGALKSQGSDITVSTFEEAGDAMDNGQAVELDMSPRKQRQQSNKKDEEKEKGE